MKKYIILMIAIIATIPCVSAQNILSDTLRWQVTQLEDLNANVTESYSCTFTTRGTGYIDWDQASVSSQFEVTSVSGTWPNASEAGEVVYQITIDGLSGQLTFGRASGSATILLELTRSNGQPLRHRYSVSQITDINQ
jgi:hypothetical protein